MKGERILIADDNILFREGLQSLIERLGEKYEHRVAGVARSVEEVRNLVEKGLRPTVALVDNNFPNRGDGEKAAEIIRILSPETTIISLSQDDGLTWGDENWPKLINAKELVESLTKLTHLKSPMNYNSQLLDVSELSLPQPLPEEQKGKDLTKLATYPLHYSEKHNNKLAEMQTPQENEKEKMKAK